MQGNAMGTTEQKRSVDLFALMLVIGVIICVSVAVTVYVQIFNLGLSSEPNNWSAFGSYIGGVLGPLISFLTLLAILKTIGLQKELLDTQRTEFEAMQALQLKAIEAQLSQIRQSESEAARRLVEESRNSALLALERYMHSCRAEYEQKKNQLNITYQWVLDGKATISSEEMKLITDKLKPYEEKLASMTLFYGDICFGEFKNVDDLKKTFQKELGEIWSPSPKKTETKET